MLKKEKPSFRVSVLSAAIMTVMGSWSPLGAAVAKGYQMIAPGRVADIAIDGGSNLTAVWVGTDGFVNAKRFSLKGGALTPVVQIGSSSSPPPEVIDGETLPVMPFPPAIASDRAGNFAVVWRDNTAAILATLFNSNGAVHGSVISRPCEIRYAAVKSW